ncbi:hypothetical protein ACFPYI_01760 [Halomarina salina]|uniref:Tat (Twin-arginine translocation) pathway signal sequence n=1 Tax=Halomarina salina TaxID=1872699 RepID=A0ABD5RHH9_9EURY|nr:hypothetical protein [Halomarina salina]
MKPSTRRRFLRSTAATAAAASGLGLVSGQTTGRARDAAFDIRQMVESMDEFTDPKARKQHAWEFACAIRDAEDSANDELRQCTTEDLSNLASGASATQTDLRSVGRLLEALHEHDIATYVDESFIYGASKKADVVMRWVPLLGQFNGVLDTARKFADAPEGHRDTEYGEFILTVACFCLEVGLFAVGAPYKLAWKGTHKIFFARSGTLFRLGRYGGDRFVAFMMSEVHYEIREALFEDVITKDKAQWVVDEVNAQHDIPEFTELRSDATRFIDDAEEFTPDQLKDLKFAQPLFEETVETGSWFSEYVPDISDIFGGGGTSGDDLTIEYDPQWYSEEGGSSGGWFGY